jgi:hypothetical protein
MDVPMRAIFMADDGEYDVPPEWELKFANAEVQDYRNGTTFLGVFTPSWRKRRSVQADFQREIEAGHMKRNHP